MNFYIFSSGNFKRKNNTLFFENDNIKKTIPIKVVDDIYILSKVQINTDLLTFLHDNQINLHIFDYYNNYKGTFLNKNGKSSKLIIEQVNYYNNGKKRLNLASKFIKGAVNVIKYNLSRYDITYDEVLINPNNISSLMGIEGNIRKTYYKNFNKIIKDFKMNGRTKRPPKDEINAIISFGNMVCYTECLRNINLTPLSPNISFLHSILDRRLSLPLDISEIFKPLLVDRIIFKLFNKKILKKTDFIKESHICLLNDSGKRKFLKEWDEKLNKTIYHKNLHKNVSFKYLIKLECYKIIKHLTNEKEYEPFKIWW